MTPEERRMLSDLAAKMSQTPSPQRDPDAEAFIRANIGNRPDALYLMTQTVLIQNLALQQAQEQIRDLQSRTQQQPAGGSSFLGGPQYGNPSAAPSAQYSAPQYAPPSPPPLQPAPVSSGAGGFLRGAAQTAAGLAAGALAFEGISSLFGHSGGMGGFGGGSGLFGGGGGRPVEETIINNNYYDDPAAGSGGHDPHQFASTDTDGTGDLLDDQDDSQLQDADFDDSGNSDSGDDSSDFA